MSITYSWKITGLKTKNEPPHENAVVQTYWTKTGTDENGNTGTFSGATPFSAANVPPEQFVPFEQLTEEIVLEWVRNAVIADYEQHVNNKIQEQIDEKINVTQDKPLPWQPTPQPTNS